MNWIEIDAVFAAIRRACGQALANRYRRVQPRKAGGRRSGGSVRPRIGGAGSPAGLSELAATEAMASSVILRAGITMHPAEAMQPAAGALPGSGACFEPCSPCVQSGIADISLACAVGVACMEAQSGMLAVAIPGKLKANASSSVLNAVQSSDWAASRRFIPSRYNSNLLNSTQFRSINLEARF